MAFSKFKHYSPTQLTMVKLTLCACVCAAVTVWAVPGPDAAVSQGATGGQSRRNQCEEIFRSLECRGIQSVQQAEQRFTLTHFWNWGDCDTMEAASSWTHSCWTDHNLLVLKCTSERVVSVWIQSALISVFSFFCSYSFPPKGPLHTGSEFARRTFGLIFKT